MASTALTISNGAAEGEQAYHAELKQSDALPYFDRKLEEKSGFRAKVDKEIADELKRMGKPSQEERLPPTYELFQSRPDLQAELERVSSQRPPQPALDTSRYTLPAPSSGFSATEEEWTSSLDNAAAQLGHMQIRLKNVELLKTYGPNLWRLHNFQQESMLNQYTDAAALIKEMTTETNRTRQREQNEAGQKLSSLERRWTELISSGLQLEVANITAEHEVQTLRSQKQALEEALARMDEQEAL